MRKHRRGETAAVDALRERLRVTHDKFCRAYGCSVPYEPEDLDPLSELIFTLLSHRTRYEENEKAFESLVERFGGRRRGFRRVWQCVREAPLQQVRDAIHAATWPEQKAPRIQAVLKRITELVGDLSLDWLEKSTPTEARRWLEQLPGVGPKTSGAVLLFSRMRMPALVVDTHHYRVSLRLGLIPDKTPLAKAHLWLEKLIPAEWTSQEYYDNHMMYVTHGRECCYFARPACERCFVLEECPFGQRRMKKKNPASQL